MAIASYNTQVMRDGYRNYVIRLTGVAVAGTDTDQAPTMLINASALNPPCLGLKVERVKFSLPNGSPLDVSLYWQATTPLLFWGMGGGDDNEFSNFGGLFSSQPAGFTGNILWGTTGLTGATPAAATISFAVIVECTKLEPIYPH
jgi:hypothetical protein